MWLFARRRSTGCEMAEAGKDQDQSMEDILQSIKRIIAEEGDPVAPPPPAEDVLDLTEMLADESSTKPAEKPAATSDMSLEEIMAAPVASMMPETETPKLPEPEAAVIPMPESDPVPMQSFAADEGLMSEATRVASMAALAALNETSMVPPSAAPSTIAFRSGTTVEDLVRESLRPMLREWIDSHLPGIVETLVEREIRKLTRG